MNAIEAQICQIADVRNCHIVSTVQPLWSGYGAIEKVLLDGRPAIVKRIDLSKIRENRRGFGGEFAHARKVNSYNVEIHFYQHASIQCDTHCVVPKCYAALDDPEKQQKWLVLEDLDDSGFAARHDQLNDTQFEACVSWLANFHAIFLNKPPNGVWPIGTYWHLATRPDELNAMANGKLKDYASEIDRQPASSDYQTWLHGDAKVANFCFPESKSLQKVAAVDFQYTGAGVGTKDLAYFISSCLTGVEAAARESQILDLYFLHLKKAICRRHINVNFDRLETQWRRLYYFAWADFVRFLLGWSPEHWKLNDYANGIVDAVISELESI